MPRSTLFLCSFKHKGVENRFIVEDCRQYMEVVLHVAMSWFNLCTLIASWETGVQPHQAPESNQSESGQVRLLKLAIIHMPHSLM